MNYDGGFNKSIRIGFFNSYLLGVFGNLLYFLEDDLYEADVFNRNKTRRILKDDLYEAYVFNQSNTRREEDSYHSMLMVDRALQPLGEL